MPSSIRKWRKSRTVPRSGPSVSSPNELANALVVGIRWNCQGAAPGQLRHRLRETTWAPVACMITATAG